ncbi:hypothetical protein [Haloferax sp. YSSS75]|uniref:hypothetical protein n=1 Tax=Haloferax sp. YSSS75 TaxID=3388564 RepID=UPI00398D087C
MPDELPADLEEYLRDKFESKREVLEALAELDNPLGEDAKKILEIFRKQNQD